MSAIVKVKENVDVAFHIESNNNQQLNIANNNNSSTMKNHNNGNALSLFSHVKYQHLLAGISGGAISTLILHPLDLMKIRFAGKKRCLKKDTVDMITLSFEIFSFSV